MIRTFRGKFDLSKESLSLSYLQRERTDDRGAMVSSAMPHQPQPSSSGFCLPLFRAGPTPCHLITAAASLRLSHFLRRRLRLSSLFLQSSIVKDLWHINSGGIKWLNILDLSEDYLSTACSCYIRFFGGDGNRSNFASKSDSDTSRRVSSSRRALTNALLIINVMVFMAQLATNGKLLLMGAKINSLIDKGQLWRLATSSLLHANIGHLMVNCYSLNSIGPAVESVCGPRRYLAVYITSAIASSSMSYWCCKSPAVGASGAIFGLVGAFAVFILRHRGLLGGGKDSLQHIAKVIVLNMVIGLMSNGIDNWGHLGGLLGGAATSWLIGPAWKYESLAKDGRQVFADRAPIFSLINTGQKYR